MSAQPKQGLSRQDRPPPEAAYKIAAVGIPIVSNSVPVECITKFPQCKDPRSLWAPVVQKRRRVRARSSLEYRLHSGLTSVRQGRCTPDLVIRDGPIRAQLAASPPQHHMRRSILEIAVIGSFLRPGGLLGMIGLDEWLCGVSWSRNFGS